MEKRRGNRGEWGGGAGEGEGGRVDFTLRVTNIRASIDGWGFIHIYSYSYYESLSHHCFCSCPLIWRWYIIRNSVDDIYTFIVVFSPAKNNFTKCFLLSINLYNLLGMEDVIEMIDEVLIHFAVFSRYRVIYYSSCKTDVSNDPELNQTAWYFRYLHYGLTLLIYFLHPCPFFHLANQFRNRHNCTELLLNNEVQ